MQPAIRAQRLTKDYGSGRGVFDLDLEVEVGEIMGFLGPNGAGKSTTMRLLLGLARPTSGHAWLLGGDVASDGLAVRRRVGYLAGDFGLYPRLTGSAVLDYFARLDGAGAARRAAQGRIAELAERFDAQLDRPIRELSTGNRQKLGLIQAFMHDPELLILDEPIAGLDPLVQRNFHDLLADVRSEGRTVLLSSHTLSEVDRVADRVVILRTGRRVVVDSIDRLRAAAVRHWEIQFASTPVIDDFRSLPEVREVELTGTRLRIAFEGSADGLMKMAARHEVVDVHTREGDLEEIFLRYYEDSDR